MWLFRNSSTKIVELKEKVAHDALTDQYYILIKIRDSWEEMAWPDNGYSRMNFPSKTQADSFLHEYVIPMRTGKRRGKILRVRGGDW